MITDDTVVVNVDPFDMPESQFTAIQTAAGSPAAPSAHDAYMILGTMPVSIAFCCALFHHESQYATDPNAIVVKHDTRNPGNCRSSRTGVGTVIMTARGPFVQYPNWAEGWRDLAWRLIDPTYVYAKEGRQTIREIITRFAPVSDNNSPESYIAAVVHDMNAWAIGGVTMAAQIDGFTWHRADGDHYDTGRTQRIRGGAQHYSAGTNSLNWLSSTSQPPVSATFLVKHNPTMDDRGWQLVRIEDTAWTTAFANPYTVSIEYEHRTTQTIPDAAYDVLAQTWIDIAAYVEAHGLGAIPLNRAGIRGHKEWVDNPSLTCPDGIDIDRIVARIQELTASDPPTGDPFDPNPSVPDRHADENPYGQFYVPQDIWARMWDDERECGFLAVGYVVSGAFVEDDKLVQYTERRRYERHRDQSIHLGLVGLEAMKARYP